MFDRTNLGKDIQYHLNQFLVSLQIYLRMLQLLGAWCTWKKVNQVIFAVPLITIY